MNYIDLHVHSTASDGTLTPEELVRRAVDIKLSAFALTDHDTVQGVAEALLTARRFAKEGDLVEVIPGTELSADYKGTDIHILGYFVDYENEIFLDMLDKSRQERETRNRKMADNLANAGIDISMEQLVDFSGDAVLTRAHFANYLTKHNYVKSIKDAFTKYLSRSGPYYVPRQYIKPEEAIHHICAAGGIPVLAHPLLYPLTLEALNELVGHLKECGIKGIETFYSANMGADENNVRKLARRYDLLMTGGSDFHGAIKPHIEMGSGRGNLKIPASILDELKALRI